jgi:hypothetical protein
METDASKLIKKLARALYIAANQAFTSEVIETNMYEYLICYDCQYETKDDWIKSKLYEWIGNKSDVDYITRIRRSK